MMNLSVYRQLIQEILLLIIKHGFPGFFYDCCDLACDNYKKIREIRDSIREIRDYLLLLPRQVLHDQLLLNLPRAGMQQG